jgi:tagatose 1,6-diphosphate aldolase GatY/KbaY
LKEAINLPLVTSEKMLLDAQQYGYAVGAFNFENMEMAQAITRSAEKLNAPVMLQTTPSTIHYAGLQYYYAIAKAAAESVSVPVAIHLDHGDSFDLAMQAFRQGYTSIMIDGSQKVFEENIAITKRVVDTCKSSGIPVEAELGRIGGKEDDLDVGAAGYTLPEEAAEFVERTGANSLAVGIGTAHGVYKSEPKLDVERLSAIRRLVSIPLVLHGASGLSDKSVRECIQRGICKVNFATELRIAFSNGVKQVLRKTPDVFDPKKYLAVGREAVEHVVEEKILVCGCNR